MMESGSLDLNHLIKYGILLLGKTKAGKTTTSHYLTHQVLEGGYNDQNNVVYKLKEADKKYLTAKIGDSEHNS
jgi:regulator of PEP synthase PpsR (kinase-PPPase family)